MKMPIDKIPSGNFEYDDDLSKFGKDGWEYIKEYPDRAAQVCRFVPDGGCITYVDIGNGFAEVRYEDWGEAAKPSP